MKNLERVKKIDLISSFILFYLPLFFVQIISGRVTITSINTWYKSLEKSSWTPPSWVFGPIWTVLYLMMAVAVWMVYRSKTNKDKKIYAYSLFFTQLCANCLWSFLFFSFHMIGAALADLCLLILLISITSVYFFRIRRLTGLLLLPYLLWSIYALYLNAAIFYLN